MKKLLARLKKNSKGFTLVELIIVIAIIAVLAAVIAPQYITYLEKARAGTDANAVGEISHAAEIASMEIGRDGDGTVTFVIDADGDMEYKAIGDLTGTLNGDVAKVIPTTQYKFKSKTYWGKSITITITKGVSNWAPLNVA